MKELIIKSVKMDENIMQILEDKGCITRIYPSKPSHRLNVAKGKGNGGFIYHGEAEYGAHSLVNVAIDNEKFISFATHPDNEEFLLLGGINERPMRLLVAFDKSDLFINKMQKGILSEKDLVCLECIFNNPYLSFFTMHKDIPHGECSFGSGRPATFYCTEGDRLKLDKIDLYKYLDIKII